MIDQPPYNNEPWDDLPLPDAEASWQKMKLLLEEDERRRRIVPLPFWRYAGLAMLMIALIAGGWWLMKREPVYTNTKIKVEAKVEQKSQKKEVKKPNYKQSTNKPEESNTISSKENSTGEKQVAIVEPQADSKLNKNETGAERKSPVRQTRQQQSNGVPSTNNALRSTNDAANKNAAVGTQPLQKKETFVPAKQLPLLQPSKQDSVSNETPNVADSSATKDSAVKPAVANNTNKSKTNELAKLQWSAGAGLQQPVALPGQSSSAYSYNGKHSGVRDYLPSVYLRVQKQKWFAQAEGIFSVPQPVNNFSFSQTTTYDAANLSLNTERIFIDKIYYHQIPVSVNRYITPSWSVGAGGVYNILAGAVTTREVKSTNITNGNESLARTVAPVKGFKDSFLYKTTAGILLQTDYHWKRLSIGLRFTQNLQPFIQYTTPNGEVISEKTRALQAVLRFRLWERK